MAAGTELIATMDPATGEVITEVPHASPADIDEAVGRARRAFEPGGRGARCFPPSGPGCCGLGASIWTCDVGRAHRLAGAMSNLLDAAAPWGGAKASGWGREMGREAIELYTEVKSVWMALV